MTTAALKNRDTMKPAAYKKLCLHLLTTAGQKTQTDAMKVMEYNGQPIITNEAIKVVVKRLVMLYNCEDEEELAAIAEHGIDYDYYIADYTSAREIFKFEYKGETFICLNAHEWLPEYTSYNIMVETDTTATVPKWVLEAVASGELLPAVCQGDALRLVGCHYSLSDFKARCPRALLSSYVPAAR